MRTDLDETRVFAVDDLESIVSVISNLDFFVAEKWRIASDRPGSGNTANIGSIQHINDLINGEGLFAKLGEAWFDDYWMNYDKIAVTGTDGSVRHIRHLEEFVRYRGADTDLIVHKRGSKRRAED